MIAVPARDKPAWIGPTIVMSQDRLSAVQMPRQHQPITSCDCFWENRWVMRNEDSVIGLNRLA